MGTYPHSRALSILLLWLFPQDPLKSFSCNNIAIPFIVTTNRVHLTTSYTGLTTQLGLQTTVIMCKLIITYRCGCKPYENTVPCKKSNCRKFKEIVQESLCEQCEGDAADMEFAMGAY